MTALVFVLALPLSVWVLAGWFALVDRGDRARALQRIAWRSAVLALPLIWLDLAARLAVVAAVAAVLSAHLGWFLLSRRRTRSGRWAAEVID